MSPKSLQLLVHPKANTFHRSAVQPYEAATARHGCGDVGIRL